MNRRGHMEKKVIEEKVKKILNEITDNAYDIQNDTSIILDLNIDSVRILYLLINLEKEFNVSFETQDLTIESLETVETLVLTIEKFLNLNT